ncbi:MAG TPA: hypothetical protein VGN33_08245 [Leifsonia sp.]|jgi:hypothetical protein|nr:hypothetical protein [Leifsonia sp.]
MASAHEYFLSATPETARAVIEPALVEQGFTVEQTPNGGFVAKRGSAAMTVLFGGMAGNKLAMSFKVEVMELQGQIVVRLSRVVASSVVTGGALGASKANSVFMQTANALGAALNQAGILTSSRQVA